MISLRQRYICFIEFNQLDTMRNTYARNSCENTIVDVVADTVCDAFVTLTLLVAFIFLDQEVEEMSLIIIWWCANGEPTHFCPGP